MIEYNYIINNSGTCSSSAYVYKNQCGWSSYTYNGVERGYFTFNDGNDEMEYHYYLHANFYQHSSALYTSSASSFKSRLESGSLPFAGLICIDVNWGDNFLNKIIIILREKFQKTPW